MCEALVLIPSITKNKIIFKNIKNLRLRDVNAWFKNMPKCDEVGSEI
jgi:hypothetical protein